jgi:hypothetical protein
VNALDFNAIATNFGAPSPLTVARGDFNYDGAIDMADFVAMAARFGTTLQANPPGGTLCAQSIPAMFAGSNPGGASRIANLFSERRIDDELTF